MVFKWAGSRGWWKLKGDMMEFIERIINLIGVNNFIMLFMFIYVMRSIGKTGYVKLCAMALCNIAKALGEPVASIIKKDCEEEDQDLSLINKLRGK